MTGLELLKNSWTQLYAAIALELGGTLAIKYSDGFSRLAPSACVIGFYAASFYLMSQAVKRIELGVAYAVWSGVGIVASSALGVILFHEGMTPRKLVSIAVIMIGVLSLNLATAE